MKVGVRIGVGVEIETFILLLSHTLLSCFPCERASMKIDDTAAMCSG